MKQHAGHRFVRIGNRRKFDAPQVGGLIDDFYSVKISAALASKLADGKLTVVESLELADAKTKAYRSALDKLDAKRTTLLVESGQEPSRTLLLGSRNLDRVELMLTKEVHPYDLLRYERAIFSRAAIEQLQETLKKTVSRRKLAGSEVA